MSTSIAVSFENAHQRSTKIDFNADPTANMQLCLYGKVYHLMSSGFNRVHHSQS